MIDTSLPPWLQRNLAQKESFDPSPWLNEAFNQNVQRAKLPLQLQGYELQNKATQLAIEHQGIQNDIANIDLDAFRQDLAKIRSFGTSTGGDPIKMLETPPPLLSSVQGQQLLSNQIKQAAATGYANRYQAFETAKAALAAKALEHGQQIPVEINPTTGQPTFSPDAIVEAYNNSALRDLVGKVFQAQAKGTPREADVAMLNAAKSELANAEASKDQKRIAAARQNLQSVTEAMPGQSVTVFDPKTGQPIVQMGKNAAGSTADLTTATTTDEQKQILNTEQTVGDLMRTRDQLNSSNVAGVWPTIANEVFDKLMGNIAPEFVSQERVKGRAAINWTRQDVINQMRQRYGEHAVERISSMLPSTGLLESPENARLLADAAIKTIAIDSAKRSFALGRPPAEHILRAISRIPNDELEKEIVNGYIPPTLASAAVRIRALPPGQMPEGLPVKAEAGTPMTVAPSTPAQSGKITWEQLFKLYQSGGLRSITNAPPSEPAYLRE